jgi:uncharacterized protein YdeI (YjbR/CyaY-like superfamily)
MLKQLRKLVHSACPQCEETIKWGVPFFTYHGILCSVAGFKAHCMFILWNKAARAEVKDFGISPAQLKKLQRFTSLDELPDAKTLRRLVQRAAELNASGVKAPPRSAARKKPPPEVPADLRAALAKNKKAQAHFRAFSPSKRKDYIVWLTDARRAETREKRLATAIAWIAAGKARNWKYEKG